MRKLWLLSVPLLAAACGSAKVVGSVTVNASCSATSSGQQVTTGTAANPTRLSEVVEVDVKLADGPTGREMAISPGGKVPFTIEGCGAVSSKVIEATKVNLQPGAPTEPPVPATVPGPLTPG